MIPVTYQYFWKNDFSSSTGSSPPSPLATGLSLFVVDFLPPNCPSAGLCKVSKAYLFENNKSNDSLWSIRWLEYFDRCFRNVFVWSGHLITPVFKQQALHPSWVKLIPRNSRRDTPGSDHPNGYGTLHTSRRSRAETTSHNGLSVCSIGRTLHKAFLSFTYLTVDSIIRSVSSSRIFI